MSRRLKAISLHEAFSLLTHPDRGSSSLEVGDVADYATIVLTEARDSTSDSGQNPTFHTAQAYLDAADAAQKSDAALFQKAAAAYAQAYLTELTPDAFGEAVSHWLKFRDSRTLAWLFAGVVNRSPEHRHTVLSRMQALTAYPALAEVLRIPHITEAIDTRKPVTDLIHHAIGSHTKRQLQAIRTIGSTLEDQRQRHRSVIQNICSLAAANIAPEVWPLAADGRSSGAHGEHTFYTSVNQTCSDAWRAAVRDLIDPLWRTVQTHEKTVSRIIQNVAIPHTATPSDLKKSRLIAAKRLVVRRIHETLIGQRTREQYAAAAERLHTYLAGIEALRLAAHGNHDKWPALCKIWTSPDHRSQIIPLTTPSDLVAEGLAMQHCVGGYAPNCRTGLTHILSVWVDERRAGTLEVTFDARSNTTEIQLGQFEGRQRRKPPADALAARNLFARAVKTGEHPINLKPLRDYTTKAAEAGLHSLVAPELTLVQAETLFPIYERHFLPNVTAGTSLTQWGAQTGLTEAFHALAEARHSI